MRLLARRRFLAGVAGATGLGLVQPALGDAADGYASRTPPDFTVRDIEVGDARDLAIAGRFTLFVPNHLAKDQTVPLLILFHGLGETGDRTTGVYAWVERYGLGTSYARLRRPPVARTSKRTDLLSDARLATLNATLGAKPFQGMVIACPYTPSFAKLSDGELERYASWVVEKMIPRVRREAPVIADAAHATVDGVSLGGFVSLEVFCRRPEAFGACGVLQPAIGVARAAGYADRIAAALGTGGRARVHLETSEGDPFREPTASLAALLTKKGVANDLVVLPGPHDQVFLRESGTMEMLLWHDRRTP